MFLWNTNTKIYPIGMDSVHNMREALVGHKYYYLSSGHPVIPYGTYLGVLVYKRFREPVYPDPKSFTGKYTCRFSRFSGDFMPYEMVKEIDIKNMRS